MCMKPAIILFLFKLERCVEHAYFWLSLRILAWSMWNLNNL